MTLFKSEFVLGTEGHVGHFIITPKDKLVDAFDKIYAYPNDEITDLKSFWFIGSKAIADFLVKRSASQFDFVTEQGFMLTSTQPNTLISMIYDQYNHVGDKSVSREQIETAFSQILENIKNTFPELKPFKEKADEIDSRKIEALAEMNKYLQAAKKLEDQINAMREEALELSDSCKIGRYEV